MTDRCEEAAFFRQSARIGNDAESVHLKTVVIVEAERSMLDNAFIKFESACLKSFAASRVAAVKYRHVVFFSHRVYCTEKAREILFGIDILLSVSGEKDVFSFFEAQFFMNVGGFDLFEI